ncbi:HDIG domain-containing protein [Candidatus Woesearchaeota archaeon]|nr:HDIG domain-containing protein [Candidatus Woesearchaeota archaeon]
MVDEHMPLSKAVALLRKYAPNEEVFLKVIKHTSLVRHLALKYGRRVQGIDLDFLGTAALLHDIGRFQCPPGSRKSMQHGVVGEEIMRREGYPLHGRVCSRHIGIGISADDIKKQGLDLPLQDYLPESAEELIITYADNLEHRGIKDEMYVEERFAREIGPEFRERVKRFHERIHAMFTVSDIH